MGSLSDILTTIQNGVVAANNLVQQTKGTLNNINSQLATIPPANIGDYVSSIILSTTPLGVTPGVTANLTSVNLSSGDWDVRGNLAAVPSGGLSTFIGSISSVSAAFGDLEFATVLQSSNATTFLTGGRMSFPLATRRYLVATSTTIYVVADMIGTSTGMAIYGALEARRMRK